RGADAPGRGDQLRRYVGDEAGRATQAGDERVGVRVEVAEGRFALGAALDVPGHARQVGAVEVADGEPGQLVPVRTAVGGHVRGPPGAVHRHSNAGTLQAVSPSTSDSQTSKLRTAIGRTSMSNGQPTTGEDGRSSSTATSRSLLARARDHDPGAWE